MIVFTMQESPDRTNVLTVEQMFSPLAACRWWGSLVGFRGRCVVQGGVWCRVVRGVCCWGGGVCEGRYPSDAL